MKGTLMQRRSLVAPLLDATRTPSLALLPATAALSTPVRPAPAAARTGTPFFGSGLPLSAPSETSTLAPGVTLTTMTLGQVDADDYWTVHVYLPAEPGGALHDATTALGSREIATTVRQVLRAQGFTARLEPVRSPRFADHPAGDVGWTVRVGRFPTARAAAAALAEIRASGFAGDTRYTAQDGTDPLAPQKVHVMRVDFDEFDGTVAPDFGRLLTRTETLTQIIEDTGALAGINAQWFYDGGQADSGHVLAGLFVKDGKLLGSATNGRGGIRITQGGKRIDVDAYRASVIVRSGSEERLVDGVNRHPGVIWNGGGIVGGDPVRETVQHDLRFTDDSELVLFTPEWGPTPQGEGAEAVLDAEGRVVAVNGRRGSDVPTGGSTLQATGELPRWLAEHAPVGRRLTVQVRVTGRDGRPVPLTRDTSVLQVGPTLVMDGEVSVNAMADGLVREGADQTFTYDWVLRSNPRSMIGRDGEGRLMLVVVDGRQAGYSEGLGIAQTAELMRLLGAEEALNLDGGGSSVMATAEGGIVNRPSDAAGQRSLGNVILVRP